MADKKVSELTAITNVSGDDLLLVVNDPQGTPSSNKITIANLFANVVSATTHKGVTTFTANTSFVDIVANTVTISANTGLVVSVGGAPSSNNPSTESWDTGTIAFSNTYMYIAVDSNTIKRVSLEVFS